MDSVEGTNTYRFRAIAIGLAVVTLASTAVARAESAAVVIDWNRIVQSAAPNWRPYAMVHIAMFDAVNSIAETYTPFRVHVAGARGASQQAAAAQAAHDVLTALFPAQQSRFGAALTSSLAGIPRGLAEQGKIVGSQVAREVLRWRQDDGWPATITPDADFGLPPFPGLYRRTPPANSAPTFTFYRNAMPFALESSTQFLPPPPLVTSERYARDFNETKELGAANSTTRTPAQTLLAQIVHGVNTSTVSTMVWNNVAADVAQSRGLSLIDAARLFALLNVSFNDRYRHRSRASSCTTCGGRLLPSATPTWIRTMPRLRTRTGYPCCQPRPTRRTPETCRACRLRQRVRWRWRSDATISRCP